MRDAVILAVLGMGTVMILLYVINLMILVLGKVFGPKQTKKTENPKQGGAASSPALVLLAAAAAVLRRAASRLAARHPAAVSPALLLALCWVLPAVCCSGALVDPAALGPFASLRFLSPAWLLSRIFAR